jgi:chromate transporter
MLFSLQMWFFLKQYRPVKASLEGINASALGLVVSGIFLMLEAVLYRSFSNLPIDVSVILITFLILRFTKISPPLLILLGLLFGIGWQVL